MCPANLGGDDRRVRENGTGGNNLISVPYKQLCKPFPQGSIVFHKQYGIHLSCSPFSVQLLPILRATVN